eukprot:s27_g41.t1
MDAGKPGPLAQRQSIVHSPPSHHPRQVSLANTRPEQMFTDVVSSSRGDAPAFVELYVAGFSCKPFSTLHHQSKLLQEDEARIFYATVDRIHQVRPSCFVLENVMGIRRVAVQVQTHLTSSGLYTVIPVEMDPADLGEPVRRPRIYFLGVRKDVALADSAVLTKVAECAWHFVKQQSSAKLAGFPAGKEHARWQAIHDQVRAAGPMPSVKPSADDLFLHLPRLRDAWNILSAKHRGHLAADLSQSVSRAGVRTDGRLPTITPGSILAVADAGRVVTPLEKILLHGFPVHRMKIPPGITDRQLEKMGGNTMHVHVVGVAILLALGLVDWSLPAAKIPCPPATVCRPRFALQGPKSKVHSPAKSQRKNKVKTRSRKIPVCKKNSGDLTAKAADRLRTRWGLPASARKKQSKPACGPKKVRKNIVSVLKGTRWG